MYNVSENFKEKIRSDGRKFKVKFLINNIEYDEGFINCFSIEHSFTDGEMKFETAMASVNLEMNDFENYFKEATLKGKEVQLFIGLEIEEDIFEYVSMGIFIIDEARREEGIIKISGYDRMKYFEKSYDNTLTKGATVLSLYNDICLKGNVEKGMTIDEGLYYEIDDISALKGYTARELLKFIAEVSGCFISINKDGKICMTREMGETEEFSESNFFSLSVGEELSDEYSGIIVRKNGEWARAYPDSDYLEEEGRVYYIDDNILIDGGDIQSIYENGYLINAVMRGFECTYQGNPAVEIGDRVIINNGDERIISVIGSVKFNYNGGFNSEISLDCENITRQSSEIRRTNKTVSELIEKVDSIENGGNTEMKNTIIEIARENIIAADVIEMSSAFVEDLFVEAFETNLKEIKCVPNIRKNEEGNYEWIDEDKGYIIPNVSGNIRAYIKAEGISLKFIEAHLTENGVKPLIINGRQVYYTSIADGENAYEYFTFTEPKCKYPEMSDENAEMFKVMIRASENEYTKAEFRFNNSGSTFEPKLMFGVGINNDDDKGKFIFEKNNEYGIFYYLAENGVDKIGVRVSENGVEYYDVSRNEWTAAGGGKGYYASREELTQEEIEGLTEGEAVFIYDIENI